VRYTAVDPAARGTALVSSATGSCVVCFAMSNPMAATMTFSTTAVYVANAMSWTRRR
jgi:hypothetical protein